MPRVRLFNTIFHLRKINEKVMLNSYKTIFSQFFHRFEQHYVE